MTIVKAFGRTIKKIVPVNIEINQNEEFEIITPRNQQRDVFENNRNSKMFQLVQPPGSGKSICVAFVMADRLKNNPNMKVIIAVPQKFIAKSFMKMIFQYDDGTQINWDCFHDLCKNSNIQKIKYLTKFLKKKTFEPGIENRVAIVTHTTLAQTYSKLSKIDGLFDNTTIVIDEAHHIMYEDSEISNRIGNMINHIFQNKFNSSLWLVTATPYRGDSNSIIPKEILETFDSHFLPLDKHWEENIKYIENFTFNFVIYKQHKILDSVKEVLKLGHNKSIIFCPYTGHLMNDSNKNKFKEKLIKTIKEEWPDCKILDLIEINGRDKRKEILLDNKDAKHVDVILTLKIFDEGSDWLPAVQCIDLAPSNTLRITHQRFGRPWRDFPGKTSIIYYCFLPFESKFKDEEERRLHLSKNFNALAASLLLQDMIQPIRYPITLKSNVEKKSYINPLEEALPEDDKRAELLEKIIKKLMVMKSVSENPSAQDVKQWISCLLTSENIINNQDQIINHIGLIFRRMNQQKLRKRPNWNDNNFDFLSNNEFDKIWLNDIFKDLKIFGTNVCTAKTFQEFRNIIKGYSKKSADEWVEYLRKRSDPETGEVLDSKTGELIFMKYLPYGCSAAIRNYPDKFTEFKFKIYPRKSVDEWVEYVRERSNPETGEVLDIETGEQIMKKDLTTSCRRMLSIYPDRFKEFKFKFKSLNNNNSIPTRTVNEWVEYVRIIFSPEIDIQLFRQNLPEACKNIIRRYPDKFKEFNFPKKRIKRDVDEWVDFLRKLVDTKTGLVPNRRDLSKTLKMCIWKFPDKFDEFIFDNTSKKRKPSKISIEHIQLAEKIAKDNNFILPTKKWLYENKFKTLANYIMHNPSLFEHIKQETEKINIKEHIQFAEKLAGNNNGVLPNGSTLIKNGYKKLARFIQNNPQDFSHIDRLKWIKSSDQSHMTAINAQYTT